MKNSRDLEVYNIPYVFWITIEFAKEDLDSFFGYGRGANFLELRIWRFALIIGRPWTKEGIDNILQENQSIYPIQEYNEMNLTRRLSWLVGDYLKVKILDRNKNCDFYYKLEQHGKIRYYGMKLYEKTEEAVNMALDVVNANKAEFITEDEFDSNVSVPHYLDIVNTIDNKTIGELFFNAMDNVNVEE